MIKYLAIHHFGGFLRDPLASTVHVTFDAINKAHRNRKDWIGYRAHLSSMGKYFGYNFFYNIKTRTFIQARVLGEETLAQRGFNLTAVSVVIPGNYSKIPGTTLTVDTMTPEMEEDIANFTQRLISGNHSYKVKKGTTINIVASRVHPHRWFQKATACYGSGLADSWIATILSRYAPNINKQRIFLMQKILKLYIILLALLEKRKIKQSLGSITGKACNGIIEEV